MCIANIDNDPSGLAKIVTGSLQGNLRIYSVQNRDYKAEDLLLEQELEQAILQVEAGRFSSNGGMQLAILHPRKLVVYNVQSMGGSYLQMNKLYEHYLEHTAANMTYGPFGGVQGVDYLCVQSYDGQLCFYECEAFAFARFLPNYLIPGPLCYCEQSDSVVTCNASFELESYKYKVLAAATADKHTGSAPLAGHQVAKKVQADWKLILGEMAIDIRPGKLTQGLQSYQSDIVILCEHNVFVVSSAGQITFQKRLEYHPACCCTYPVPGAKVPGGVENLLVATHTRALLVYRGNVLSWAARMDMQPVAVQVADLGPNMRGMIVTLDDTGHVVVSYLGTDPLLTPVGFVEGKELDYEAMAKEHRALAAIIREQSGGKRVEPPDKLIMRAQVPSRFDSAREGGEWDELGNAKNFVRRLTVKLYLTYQGGASSVDNVHLSVRAPEPVSADQPNIVVPSISGDASDPSIVLITFLSGNTCLPASNTATVVATFMTGTGEPRAQSVDIELPLCLFATVVPPVKNAAFKLTVAANRTPPQIVTLFEDLISQAGPGTSQSLMNNSAGANVLSVQYYSGQDCTILVSKNGGRYRLQSDNFDAIWLLLHELVKRLAAYYEEAEGGAPVPEGKFSVAFEEALPLEDFFDIVDQHFNARSHVASMRKQLEDRAVQFRNIQKRLLIRFKDKNPAPLNQLDFLMDETYRSIMELGTAIDNAQELLKTAALKLSCSVQLILQLIRYRFKVSPEEFAVLRNYLSPEVLDGSEVGWEEHVEASMTHLLRTALAKSAKEAAVSVPPLAPSKDTSKLKKHLSLVLERLAKGMRWVLEPEDQPAPPAARSMNRQGSSTQR